MSSYGRNQPPPILTTVYSAVDDLHEDIFMQIKCDSTGVITHHNLLSEKWLNKVVFLLSSYFPSMLILQWELY